jgi:hypothetical protein
MSKPDDEEVLKSFYKNVRPWGFWKPIHEKVKQDNPGFSTITSCSRDFLNVAIGIVWQFSLVILPIYLLIHHYTAVLISALVLLITTLFLKKNWYNK